MWGGRSEKTYFDVRIFNPHAPSNKNMAPSACYKKHEREKKRAYEQRVREIEHSSFTPLVLAATGGLGIEATTFYKRLASKLSQKWDSPYSTTLCSLQCRLAFSLWSSSIQAIRGARSSCGHAVRSPGPMDLITAELRITDAITTHHFFQSALIFVSFYFSLVFMTYIILYIKISKIKIK